jgi:Lar family restriction alleviation protein
MTEKLKLCPFCGGEAQIYSAYDSTHCVQCTVCGITTLHTRNKADAIAVWNRRPPARQLTLEEMREMALKCEPIYISRIGDDTPIFRGNKIVGGVLDMAAVMNVATYLPLMAIYGYNLTLAESDYGKTWVAYDRPPGGDDNGD